MAELVQKKLKYLLVMPRLVLNIGDGYSFPLGIPYISSSMKAAGYQVTTLNLNHREGDISKIIPEEIAHHQIDVVATGGLSYQFNTVRQVVESAKKFKQDIITVVGGGIITSDPQPAMDAIEYADFGVIGEGELTICELCKALETNRSFSTIPGLIYRKNAIFQITAVRKEIENIDFLPWPDYEGFEFEKYLLASPGISGLNTNKTIFMIASRSCPYNCTFCFHTVGQKYRQRTLDNFFNELAHMINRYNIDFICLADELFSVNVDRVMEFCKRIKEYGIKWWAQFRVDKITPEQLPLLKTSGCEVMSFGLESADNRVLKSMKKETTVEQIGHALKLVYDAGISLEGAFIFGDIAETWETAQNTLTWWKEHAQYKISLNLITIYPGCFLYEYACSKGIIKDRKKYLQDGCPQINVSHLTEDQYSELIRIIMEVPVALTKSLSVHFHQVDYKKGRIDISGLCSVCGEENSWKTIKLFTSNFIGCKNCGQKYHMALPGILRDNIDHNIKKLVELFGKIAIWGINYHTADLVKNSDVLKDSRVFPIDISSMKRRMNLYGKEIFPPQTIDSEKIPAVIIAVPVYYNQIEGQINANHKKVEFVVDLCQLTDPDFIFPQVNQFEKAKE